jgi:hypothetical protein
MNDAELTDKVRDAMDDECRKRGYAAPVDVLVDLGLLQKNRYDDWRAGRVLYMESVCTCNLHKLTTVMQQMRLYAREIGLKPSFSCYKGKGRKLRFSKSGSPEIENRYATHFVDVKQVELLKQAKNEKSDS